MQQTAFNQQHDVEIISRETVYKSFTQVDVVKLKHRLFAGGISPLIQRELVIKPEAIGVLIYDPDLDAVLLIEQFRVGALSHPNPWQLEIVAGLVDGYGESLEEVAKREVIEEAGVELSRLETVMTFLLSPGGSNEKFTLFVGQADLSTITTGNLHGLPEEGEDIRVNVLAAEQAIALLKQDILFNAPLLIALQWLALNKKDLQTRWQN
ncbi:MAG: NUDIX domain-containing protein [Agitococcus sp.]